MLTLSNIVKEYPTGDQKVTALRGISISFRKSEFVAVLGQSGCGKTTMLNIVGGLDQYTSGDLIINGRSTKDYKDSDWDSYRNHSIGFVFQSYNLIPHQTVLANVELALTLSGVPKQERRKRAIDALTEVGLGDQLNKKPNQMSGGQMQRVAIARALVNNPDILLADEPTGALDSETSVQIMELLKKISKDRLIIMVTHNPELAEQYANRIVRLLDGQIISDTKPYSEEEANKDLLEQQKIEKKSKKTSMSFKTAISLSLNNLMTKKGRTFMVAFAGSIGIIGIALILSLSSGFQGYIKKVEEDTLSSYPIQIQDKTVDFSSLMLSMMGDRKDDIADRDPNKVYSSDIMGDMFNTMLKEARANNLEAFREHIIESGESFSSLVTDVQYGYNTKPLIFRSETEKGIVQSNPSVVMDKMGLFSGNSTGSMDLTSIMSSSSASSQYDAWGEMINAPELLKSQYDVLAGRWPQSYDEVVIRVNKYNQISDIDLYSLGIKDQSKISSSIRDMMMGKPIENEVISMDYQELLDLKFTLVLNPSIYSYDEINKKWVDRSKDEDFMKKLIADGIQIKVVGVVRPNENATAAAITSTVGYTHMLTEYILERLDSFEIIKKQKENPEYDVFTGLPFDGTEAGDEALKKAEENKKPEVTLPDGFDPSKYPEGVPGMSGGESGQPQDPMAGIDQTELMKLLETLPEEEKEVVLKFFMSLSQAGQNTPNEKEAVVSESTYDINMSLLGYSKIEAPNSINIYPVDFEAKEKIEEFINAYNDKVTSEGKEEYTIEYTDYIGLMMSSVSSIINAITYVLIAFVAISLVVSSIMISIITYISVLERTKEIGILRSIGASKKDVSRVFRAETFLIGLTAGVLGIVVTILLNIPIDMIIHAIADISGVAKLPVVGALVLIAISVLLTTIAGLVPSKIAAKKDPVIALRSE